MDRRHFLISAAALALAPRGVRAADMPGVTASEIKIGQTAPYSGPASAYGAIGRAGAAYFKYINDQGGVNGRKINFISLDDSYSPPKSVEQARRLVEQEQVACLFNCIGTASNLAIRQYCNENKVPQILSATGASVFDDPRNFAWTTPGNPFYTSEGRVYAKYLLQTKPDAKVAVLYQNDGLGKDYLIGLKEALGADHLAMIVKEASYETSEPTVDSQVTTLQGSGADVLLILATPKFAAQAIRKSFDLGWDATRFVSIVSVSIPAVMKPAGLEKAKGVITAGTYKDVNDDHWKDDAGVKNWAAFCEKYMGRNDFADGLAFYGYSLAHVMVHVVKQCGDDLSRDNILRQATGIKDFDHPILLPGIRMNTSPDSYKAYRQLQLSQFDGTAFRLLGSPIDA